jgi:uncharacterized protein YacL
VKYIHFGGERMDNKIATIKMCRTIFIVMGIVNILVGILDSYRSFTDGKPVFLLVVGFIGTALITWAMFLLADSTVTALEYLQRDKIDKSYPELKQMRKFIDSHEDIEKKSKE